MYSVLTNFTRNFVFFFAFLIFGIHGVMFYIVLMNELNIA